MEQNTEDLRIWPLPGDRQGTSGAGAGRGSMRTVSGRRLSRRIPTNQSTTADTRASPTTDTPHISARSVLQDMLPATTLAGRERKRMKWTHEVNQQLLRCYYTVTNCETNLTGYRPLLYTKFIEVYPDLHFLTEQRLADQVRVIHRNNKITLQAKEQMKKEVEQELNNRRISNTNYAEQTSIQQSTHRLNTQRSHTTDEILQISQALNSENTQPQIVDTPISTPPPTFTQLTQIEIVNAPEITESEIPDSSQHTEQVFNECLIKYKGTDPTLRPHLQKLRITQRSKTTINTLNHLIGRELINKMQPTLEELQELIYCAALTATIIHNNRKNLETNAREKRNMKPAWEKRIENNIVILRKEIGQLNQFIKENLSRKNQIKMSNKYKNKQEAIEILDKKTQRLQALSKRLRRYKISNQRHNDNMIFNSNQKLFYRNFNKEFSINDPPDILHVEEFWSHTWAKSAEHNIQAEWIEEEIDATQHISEMSEIIINKIDVQVAVNRTLNWKTPGTDKIHNYWLKYFTSTHEYIANAFTTVIHNPQSIPKFLTQGNTYLKPKDTDTKNPAKYRPITCLPTIYKLLTSIISHKINKHLTNNKIIAEEQKGCRKYSKGCKEQLIIDTEIHHQVKQSHRNLYYAYIDYQKAYDSVPHSWLLHILKIYKIDNALINFLQHSMQKWTTVLNLNTNTGVIQSNPIKIARGIFQGDSLSPLWFCMALNPLSRILNKTGQGYMIHSGSNSKITHLLYMDDIKLYAANKPQIHNLLKVTENFSTDINMNFGIDKCKINSIIRGKHNTTDPYTLQTQQNLVINKMDCTDTYKYLGYSQGTSIDHSQIKAELIRKYTDRLHKLLKTELSGRNIVKAINTFAIPILTYSFGIVKWTTTDLDRLNRITRTTCNKYNIHHIHSAIERFNLQRKLGGRGLVDIKNLHIRQVQSIRTYMHSKIDDSPIHKALTLITTSGTALKLNDLNNSTQITTTVEQKISKWKQKPLHGKYPHQLQQEHIDREASTAWLYRGNIYKETEGFMIAIQDQIIKTKNYQKYIMKDSTVISDRCRLCNNAQETIDHITGGCSFLANKQYTERHNNVAKQIHSQLALKYKLINKIEPYYKYKPKSVLNNEKVKLYWDRDVVTDKTTTSNRPDLILTLKDKNITYLIDIAIPNTENIRKKYTEKIQKYIPLADEIRQMWHQHMVKIIPIIISSTGLIPKSLHASLKEIDLHKLSYISLQKSVIIDTCSIVRRFLTSTTQTPSTLDEEPNHLA